MSGGQDKSQWLAVTEETLFLHDGLMRVTDLIELPHDVSTTAEGDHEVVSFDSKSPTELSEKLMNVCGTQNNAYSWLLEYRLNSLRGYWGAQQQIAYEDQNERDATSQEETLALLKKHNLWKEPEQASFSTRISLLLTLPLLQSQSKVDPSLCGITADLLLSCLKDCPPISLSKEPVDCLNGLEKLLSRWLGEKDASQDSTQEVQHPIQRESAAAAFVALACARGHLKMFVHTIHLLLNLRDLGPLPVADLLDKLLDTEGGQGQPTSVSGNRHILCWGFEDMLTAPDKENGNLPPGAPVAGVDAAASNNNTTPASGAGNQPGSSSGSGSSDKAVECDIGRSVTTCGKYIYTTSSTGKGLVKVGTGLHGTLRGYLYARNPELGACHVAFGCGVLMARCTEMDTDTQSQYLAELMDVSTLKPVKKMEKPVDCLTGGPTTTIAFFSDGDNFGWIWCNSTITDKNAKYQNVYLDYFRYDPPTEKFTTLRERILLIRKEEGSMKSLNETLLARLRPYRSTSMATTLVTLTGTEPQLPRKDEVATNLCFDVEDGQFNNRSELMDATTCAIARGSQVLGMGVCYDVVNNMIWTVSNDWVDQFYNPGHQSWHHILSRLGIDPYCREKRIVPKDNLIAPLDIVQQLLEHVGAMCLHQLNSDMISTPMGSYLLQHDVDIIHFQRIIDIVEYAVKENNKRTLSVTLVVLQLLFHMSTISHEDTKVSELVHRISKLLWEVLDRYQHIDPQEVSEDAAILREVCRVISAGLSIIYPQPKDRCNLLQKLLADSDKMPGLCHLRDLILIDFADQLRNQIITTDELCLLRLPDDLVHYILKIAVKESFVLLRKCQTTDRAELDSVLASVPMASPCLRYLMALQSHLLRECVLHREEEKSEEAGTPTTVPTPKSVVREKLTDLQAAILTFASNVFSSAYQVLEVLLEISHSIINNPEISNLEYWLQGLERISKATILGHLVPVLLTAMTHENVRCLTIADQLMSQLVQLVVLTSQAALLLKSHVQVVQESDSSMDNRDTDIADLLGETIQTENVEIQEKEEEGFLSGLKIPAPWTSGKSIESIHPVRDNYKYKETVHIPGARCLYLRFDPRCSSQYDYDKLVIYAGPNTNSRRVAEYGGNTLGYGSKSVLGSGWPKDLVKVEGDTVTLSFEMRSGREHNTPDKAMWGFLITVRAQDSTEEVASGLPFLPDLALGLSVLACTMLHLLYQGPTRTKEEEACQHLLKSKLLQRCVWQSESDIPLKGHTVGFGHESDNAQLPSPSHKALPRIKLPSDIISKLREMAERQPPQIRPSIRSAVQPEVLEECIVSAAIKHSGLGDTVRDLSSHEENQTEEHYLLKDIMSEVYKQTYAMLRQLQSIAELEQRWKAEVEDVQQGNMPLLDVFFLDYHLVENKDKTLAILCFLKDIPFDPSDLDGTVTNLRNKFEMEVSFELAPSTPTTSPPSIVKTRAVVNGVIEKLELLLAVNIAPVGDAAGGMIRSVSHMPDVNKLSAVMIRSDTEVLRSGLYTRSISAPSDIQGIVDDSVLEITRLQKRRQAQKKGPASILQDLVEEDRDRSPQAALIDQLFSFIGSNPEKAVSCESFLATARVRWRRGSTRQQALIHMRALLTAATRVGGATHLVAAVTSVLQHGPRVDELTCGGMADHVREAFAETMTSVVQLAAHYPIACCNSIGLLCIIPYTRAEEKCLVRSGLVHLLDRLCSLTSHRGEGSTSSETQSMRQRVSSMAWAGFQVLSNRCVMWEQDDAGDQLERSGLARQVSTLLTNHLARATRCIGNEAAGSEALQEVLSLLNSLSRSRMGKAILSQPECVSKLLSLLLDQRPSPKLVLIILQLCRVALPLMTSVDCDRVELPTWGQELHQTLESEQGSHETELKIASLLLAKLGDFLVPGGQTTISSRRPSFDSGLAPGGSSGIGSDKDKSDETDVHDGRLSVFVHKRDDQSSHEVIQPFLSSSESRPFRLAGGANMEKIVRLDREMTKNGKAEVTTEEAVSALRKAAKWAQMGLVVSTGSPIDTSTGDSHASDKKKTAVEVVCKEKNAELARTDPVRPFISGHVANSMAAEVIGLLHCLLTAPETMAAQSWASAVEKVISNALSSLSLLLHSVDDIGSPRCNKEELMVLAKQANAALAALGGFEETVKPESEVHIAGPDKQSSRCHVESVSEHTGLATVQLLPSTDDDFLPPRYSDTVQVPLSRLRAPGNEPLPLSQLSVTDAIVSAVQALLLPQDSSASPLSQPLPIHGSDALAMPNQICRVVSEIRTRACNVLATHLKDLGFASSFIQHASDAIDVLKCLSKDCNIGVVTSWIFRACNVLATHLKDLGFASSFIQHASDAIDVLKCLSKDCNIGDREDVVKRQCDRLGMLYRDCAKPPPPPSKMTTKPLKEITWNPSRGFPPVRSCLFSNSLTGVTFLGDPSSGSGFPRGTLVYALQSIPQQAPSFYWEIEICSFGESLDESGPIFAFGFMPAAEKKDGAWTNPVGSCLFHNNGRAVHYNGSSLLQWRSARLDVTLNSGDVAGIGWERQGEAAAVTGQTVKGSMFFTYNGRRLNGTIEDVLGNMFPVVHIQKKIQDGHQATIFNCGRNPVDRDKSPTIEPIALKLGEECPSANPVRHFDIQRESKPSVHDDLTMKEIEDVYDYMAGLREFSGLKEASTLTIESSYIYMIERHPPPKSEVLAYQAGTGPKPKRFALVIMFRGDLPTPVIEEYKVGPLPNIEGYEKLQIAGRDSIDYIKRSYFANADLAGLQTLIRRELGKIDHLLSQVLGGYRMNNCTTKCLTWFPGMPGEFVLGDRSMWVFIHRQHEGFYVLPIGLQFRVDMDLELDVKDWKVNFVYFRGDTFESIDSMAATYTPPSNNDPLILVDDNNLYSSLKHRGDPLPEKKQRGPRAFMPDGQRFTVDGHHVEWQGWSFDFNLRTRIGLQVHDVLFKNEKVAYELSLSEIGIMYSGASPLPMHTAYVDSTFHLGWESYELVVGVDCPDHATYFDFAHYFNFKPMLYKNSVCIFEHDSGIPLRRHYESNRDGTYSFVQGMPGNVLKLKAVMSVYNYEYLLDYTFHQNGAIEVTVTLSGYILSSFYSGEPADDRYGFEVSPEGLGSIHNHMVHLKADLDILGEKNRFETFDIKVDEIRDPADASKNIYVHKFERNLRETEQDATWEYNMNTPKYLIVYNDEKDNPFGNKRGYRIVPISVNAQLLPQEWTVEKSFSWARYQAAVTKQKDSESRASSIYNMADISDPVVKFQDFIDDDESIVDEDLVAWITLGSFHIPRTEDIPIVTTPAFSLRYYLLPYNYFDEDPSLASRDNIRVTPKSNGEKNVQYVGVSPDETCSDMVTASASGVSAKSNILAGLLVLLISGKLL